MSGEQTPVLGGALPAFETFIAQWKAMSTSPDHPQLCAFLKEGLSSAAKYHECMRANDTYVYAMCKLVIIFSTFGADYPQSC